LTYLNIKYNLNQLKSCQRGI
ncbi:unnamed protein product, partial [Rotaria sp. Silwood1]